jgi:hypothetical protein
MARRMAQTARKPARRLKSRRLPKPKVAGSRPVVRFLGIKPNPAWLGRCAGSARQPARSARVRQSPLSLQFGGADGGRTNGEREVSDAVGFANARAAHRTGLEDRCGADQQSDPFHSEEGLSSPFSC